MSAIEPITIDSPIDEALALAERGIPVFPCRADKRPLTANGFHDATTDPDTLDDWWRQHPGALVGVPTGEASGLDVLDVDPDGDSWATEHAEILMAAGRIHHTPRGRHYLFLHADGVRNSAGKIAPGVDVRGEGGFAIWWPAHGYDYYGEIEEVTPIPDAFAAQLAPQETQQSAPAVADVILDGKRNDYLSREAYRLRRQGAGIEQIHNIIAAMNQARCEPPIPDAEVRKVAEGKRSVGADLTPNGDASASPFRLIRAGDLEIKPPNWLIEDRLEVDTLGLIFGDPKAGKSFIAVDKACCVATGTEYHECGVEPYPVIYIAGEGHTGIARRFKAWEIARGVSLKDAPLYVSAKAAALLDPGSVNAVVDAVDEIVSEHGIPGLIVIDTLARNFGPGDENSTPDMNLFVQAADRLRSQHSAAVLIVHHTGHADKQRARGSIALKGAIDAEYRVDAGEDGIVRVECTAMKDAKLAPPMAFRLSTVELGIQDHRGRPVTSAVPDSADYAPPPRKGSQGRGKNQSRAMDILRRLHGEHRQRVAESGRDPEAARVSLEVWRDAMRSEGVPKASAYEMPGKLREAGLITTEGGFVWPV